MAFKLNPFTGKFDIALSSNQLKQFNYWNGSFLESHQLSVTSDGATIDATLEKSGTGDLTMRFSDGYTILDCTPIQTIQLTAGTATAPVMNYVYVLQSNKALTVSTSNFPTNGTEHLRVGTITVRTASQTQVEGALVSRWNDHSGLTSDGRGHSLHIAEWIRQNFGTHKSGTEATISIVGASSPDDVYLTVTDGVVYQLHKQDYSGINMSTGGHAHVVNHPTTPFIETDNLNDQLTDANGDSMSGNYFTLVVWGINSSGGEEDFTLINLPTGSYNNEASALADVSGYTVYDISSQFKNTGFLIGQFTFKHSAAGGGAWTQTNYIDLRGKQPNNTAGSSTGASGITTLLGLIDTPVSYSGESGKVLAVNSGETLVEFVSAGVLNLEGGVSNSNYGAVSPIDGGTS